MKTQILYTYLGTNGILTTPIHLDGIQAMLEYELTAQQGCLLTGDNGKTTTKHVVVKEADLPKWREIKDPGQD